MPRPCNHSSREAGFLGLGPSGALRASRGGLAAPEAPAKAATSPPPGRRSGPAGGPPPPPAPKAPPQSAKPPPARPPGPPGALPGRPRDGGPPPGGLLGKLPHVAAWAQEVIAGLGHNPLQIPGDHAHALKHSKSKGKAPVFPGPSGAGDGTRTRTGVTPQRILSPQRLPFRHPGGRFPCYSKETSPPSLKVRSAPRTASPLTR